MVVKIVTYWETLMRYAKDEAAAVATGDPVLIANAKAAHEAYRQMCVRADEMVIPDWRGK